VFENNGIVARHDSVFRFLDTGVLENPIQQAPSTSFFVCTAIVTIRCSLTERRARGWWRRFVNHECRVTRERLAA
jgi:hypothetical protein